MSRRYLISDPYEKPYSIWPHATYFTSLCIAGSPFFRRVCKWKLASTYCLYAELMLVVILVVRKMHRTFIQKCSAVPFKSRSRRSRSVQLFLPKGYVGARQFIYSSVCICIDVWHDPPMVLQHPPGRNPRASIIPFHRKSLYFNFPETNFYRFFLDLDFAALSMCKNIHKNG